MQNNNVILVLSGLLSLCGVAETGWAAGSNRAVSSSAENSGYYYFNQTAMPLSDALVRFAVQTGVNLLVDNTLVEGLRSSPLIGQYTAGQALHALLALTPLQYQYSEATNTFHVIPAEALSDKLANTEFFTSEASIEAENLEEMLVRGIKNSLVTSTRIKRESVGIVDAVAAVDIRKMPDSNLADSAQRITGVSVNRNQASDVSKLTVRGFGPEFNLTLLNGRVLPTAEVSGINDPWLATASRSFNFALLSADNVEAVEVLKTADVSLPAGATGATVNIHTAQPLQQPGVRASAGIKAIADTSLENSDSHYEASGLFSATLWDDRFGILLAGAYQDTAARRPQVSTDRWFADLAFSERLNNQNGTDFQQIWLPTNLRFSLSGRDRQRSNLHLTTQLAPTETFLLTLDYSNIQQRVEESSDAMNFEFDTTHFFEDTLVTDGDGSARYFGHDIYTGYRLSSHVSANTDAIDVFGLNMQLALGEHAFEMDAYTSKSSSTVAPEDGYMVEMGVRGIESAVYDWQQSVPSVSFTPGIFYEADPKIFHLVPERAFRESKQTETTISAVKFQDTWTLTDNLQLLLGVSHSRTKNISAYLRQAYSPGWHEGWNAPYDVISMDAGNGDIFADYLQSPQQPFAFPQLDVDTLIRLYEGESYEDTLNTNLADDKQQHRVEEAVSSGYANLNWQFSLGEVFAELAAGVRYEQTEVTAISDYRRPEAIYWYGPFGRDIRYSQELFRDSGDNRYSNLLPALHVRLETPWSLVVRLSHYASLTRPDLQLMRPVTDVSDDPMRWDSRSDLWDKSSAAQGNPMLEPYTSVNSDLSLEYYYQDSNFFALAFFTKDIDHYVGYERKVASVNDIREPYYGPRIAEAINTLQSQGPISGDKYAEAFKLLTAEGPDFIVGEAEDPLADWMLTRPVNSARASVSGWEWSWQHIFEPTGWGFSANYTQVSSDSEYDVTSLQAQSVIPGISDTLNAIGFYESEHFYVRLAYNWRDSYTEAPQRAANFFSRDIYPLRTQPYFIDDYSQWDFSLGFYFTEQVKVYLEGLNITGEDMTGHGRYDTHFLFKRFLEPVYQLGIDVNF